MSMNHSKVLPHDIYIAHILPHLVNGKDVFNGFIAISQRMDKESLTSLKREFMRSPNLLKALEEENYNRFKNLLKKCPNIIGVDDGKILEEILWKACTKTPKEAENKILPLWDQCRSILFGGIQDKRDVKDENRQSFEESKAMVIRNIDRFVSRLGDAYERDIYVDALSPRKVFSWIAASPLIGENEYLNMYDGSKMRPFWNAMFKHVEKDHMLELMRGFIIFGCVNHKTSPENCAFIEDLIKDVLSTKAAFRNTNVVDVAGWLLNRLVMEIVEVSHASEREAFKNRTKESIARLCAESLYTKHICLVEHMVRTFTSISFGFGDFDRIFDIDLVVHILHDDEEKKYHYGTCVY